MRSGALALVVGMAVAEGLPIHTANPKHEWEVLGVNSKVQLAELERAYQRSRADALMEAGVRLADPARLDLRGTLTCGTDVEIDVGSLVRRGCLLVGLEVLEALLCGGGERLCPEAFGRADHVALVGAVFDLAHDALPVRGVGVVARSDLIELETKAGVSNLLTAQNGAAPGAPAPRPPTATTQPRSSTGAASTGSAVPSAKARRLRERR